MNSSFTRLAALLAALIVLVANHGASAACDPETALYEDEFDFLDVSWGSADDSILINDDALQIRGSGGVVNLETKTKAADVCVDVTIEEAEKVSDSPAGVVFWWEDWQNYYAVFVWSDGWIEVRRMQDGSSKTLFTQETDALNAGAGAVNNIELTLQPKDATLIVNGSEVRRFKAKRPKDGGAVGLYGISPDGAPATFSFDNLIVNAR
jgi:hypothetical protein